MYFWSLGTDAVEVGLKLNSECQNEQILEVAWTVSGYRSTRMVPPRRNGARKSLFLSEKFQPVYC